MASSLLAGHARTKQACNLNIYAINITTQARTRLVRQHLGLELHWYSTPLATCCYTHSILPSHVPSSILNRLPRLLDTYYG